MTTVPDPATEPDPIHADDWTPESSGDTIAGHVTGRETKKSEKYANTFAVLTIRNGDDAEKRVACARTHLAQLVAEHDPQPGDGIAITFFGERPDGYGYQYGMRVAKPDDDDDVPF